MRSKALSRQPPIPLVGAMRLQQSLLMLMGTISLEQTDMSGVLALPFRLTFPILPTQLAEVTVLDIWITR